MKAVIYARYSSDNQREESIEGQIDCFAKTYCRIHFCQSKNCLRSIPLCAQNSVLVIPLLAASWIMPTHFFIRTLIMALSN